MYELHHLVGLPGLYNDRMYQLRSRVIAEIIIQRNFEVPRHFIELYVTDAVITELASHSDINPMSYNASTDCESHTLYKFASFLKDVAASDVGVNILSPKFIKELSPRVYVLLLSDDSQWNKYLKYSRRSMRWVSLKSSCVWGRYLIYLIQLFISEGLDIPSDVIEAAITYKRGRYLQDYFLSDDLKIDDLTTIVRSMDKCRYILPKYPEYLNSYWIRGGLYFPKYIFTIPQNKLISDLEDLYERNICKQRRERFTNNDISLNYLVWKYTPAHVKFILSSDLDVHFANSSLHLDVSNYIVPDLLKNYANYDVNLLSSLFRLYVPTSDINDAFTDRELYSQLKNNMITACIPMTDFSLFTKLRGVNTPCVDEQKAFLIRGGAPLSILSAGVPKPYNVCYRKEGLRIILIHSFIDDIVDIIDNDPTFRYYLNVYMDDDNFDFLIKGDRLTLIEAIAKSNYCDDPELLSISIMLMRSMGIVDTVKAVPTSMSMLMKRETSEYDYASLVDCTNSDTLPYIPVHLLSEVILLRHLSYNPTSNEYQRVNCDTVKLDYVVSKSVLDQIILQKGWICYVPELTYTLMDEYIDELAHREFESECGEF